MRSSVAVWSSPLSYLQQSARLAQMILTIAPAALCMPGCGSSNAFSEAAIVEGSHGEELATEADWNDIDAAVIVGASAVEMAVVSGQLPRFRDSKRNDKEDGLQERNFALKTIRDEPVILILTRSQATPEASAAPQTIVLRAKVGLFGDKETEHRLMRAVAGRLEALKGRETAPLP